MGPAASGRRLCDIVRILFTVTKSAVKNLGSPCMTKIYPLSSKPKDPSYRYAFVVSQFFDKRLSNSEYYSIDITQSAG